MSKLRLVYMGTPEFAVLPLKALCEDERFEILVVVSQPDRPQGRRAECLPTPVKRCAEAFGIKVLQPTKLKDGLLAEQLRALRPDFLLTCAYGRILPPDILQVPSIEALNLHASLLPKYRGAAPMQWALIEGERETGVSLMRMDEELDHGAVFSQRRLAIPERMNLNEMTLTLARLAAEMAVEDLPRIASGELVGREQAHSEATFTRMLRREDGLLDWQWDAQRLADLVRGTQPWPGAYSFFAGKRLKVLRAEALPESVARLKAAVLESETTSGCLIKDPEFGLLVLCGAGEKSFLRLLEVQAEGGKAVAAKDFANRLAGGERLGEYG